MAIKSKLLLLGSLFTVLAPNFLNAKQEIKVSAAVGTPSYVTSLTKDINLNKNTDEEIRAYYSSLNTLSEDERDGENLLKNLRPILQNMDYFSYKNVWKIYEITDREWELSPASDTTYGTYDATNNKITNYTYGESSSNRKNDPYVRTLYRNRDAEGITISAARIKEWDSHQGTTNATNREHIWCQSRGFKDPEDASGPAGTDLHHLRSGDAYVNITLHNDNPYGEVDRSKSYTDGANHQSWLKGNLLGKALNISSQDNGTVVFEPQDSDKGDIARAVFYMAACYNNLDGNASISQYNPNLKIVDYIYSSSEAISSSATTPATMAKLSDLLKWHKLDPVDEFEIYRNDLIFNNYQHNRNPFIDFPGWVDVIWGNAEAADPSKDAIHNLDFSISTTNITINLKVNNKFELSGTTLGKTITWQTSDSEILRFSKPYTYSGEKVEVTALKTGTATITASTAIEGTPYTLTCQVTVIDEAVAPTDDIQIEPWMYIAAGVAVVVVIIAAAVSTKFRKKLKSKVKKQLKNNTKSSSKKKKKK